MFKEFMATVALFVGLIGGIVLATYLIGALLGYVFKDDLAAFKTEQHALVQKCKDAGGTRMYIRDQGYVCFSNAAIIK